MVTDANLDCNEQGITMQAMDSSHVSLCALQMKSEGFEHYRCDKNVSLGISTKNFNQILSFLSLDHCEIAKEMTQEQHAYKAAVSEIKQESKELKTEVKAIKDFIGFKKSN